MCPVCCSVRFSRMVQSALRRTCVGAVAFSAGLRHIWLPPVSDFIFVPSKAR